MQDEIKLLNEKIDYLTDGSRRLHGLYDKRGEQIQHLQNKCDDSQKSKQDVERNIQTLQDNNDELKNQLTSKNKENENLRNQIRLLESENARIQSDLTKMQTKSAKITASLTPIAHSPIFEKNAVFDVSTGYKIGEIKSYYHNYEFSMEIKNRVKHQSNGRILQGKLIINLS